MALHSIPVLSIILRLPQNFPLEVLEVLRDPGHPAERIGLWINEKRARLVIPNVRSTHTYAAVEWDGD